MLRALKKVIFVAGLYALKKAIFVDALRAQIDCLEAMGRRSFKS